MIDETVSKLAVYALQTGLIQENEYTWANCLANGGDLRASELTAKHADWADDFDGSTSLPGRTPWTRPEGNRTGFAQVLEHAGVYSTPEGKEALANWLRPEYTNYISFQRSKRQPRGCLLLQ